MKKHFCTAIHYILDNPVKAGLVKEVKEWPWTYVNLDSG
ncbi:hypothetical protein LNTAR_01702, partial [Lentisphaera araneosa HTCC2155]